MIAMNVQPAVICVDAGRHPISIEGRLLGNFNTQPLRFRTAIIELDFPALAILALFKLVFLAAVVLDQDSRLRQSVRYLVLKFQAALYRVGIP